MRVVDASAMVDVLLATPNGAKLLRYFDDDLFAPDLLVPEVYRALQRVARNGQASAAEADALADVFTRAPVEYVGVWPRMERVWGLRHGVSLYDACYVVVAEELRAPLVTSDLRLARAASGMVEILTP